MFETPEILPKYFLFPMKTPAQYNLIAHSKVSEDLGGSKWNLRFTIQVFLANPAAAGGAFAPIVIFLLKLQSILALKLVLISFLIKVKWKFFSILISTRKISHSNRKRRKIYRKYILSIKFSILYSKSLNIFKNFKVYQRTKLTSLNLITTKVIKTFYK